MPEPAHLRAAAGARTRPRAPKRSMPPSRPRPVARTSSPWTRVAWAAFRAGDIGDARRGVAPGAAHRDPRPRRSCIMRRRSRRRRDEPGARARDARARRASAFDPVLAPEAKALLASLLGSAARSTDVAPCASSCALHRRHARLAALARCARTSDGAGSPCRRQRRGRRARRRATLSAHDLGHHPRHADVHAGAVSARHPRRSRVAAGQARDLAAARRRLACRRRRSRIASRALGDVALARTTRFRRRPRASTFQFLPAKTGAPEGPSGVTPGVTPGATPGGAPGEASRETSGVASRQRSRPARRRRCRRRTIRFTGDVPRARAAAASPTAWSSDPTR